MRLFSVLLRICLPIWMSARLKLLVMLRVLMVLRVIGILLLSVTQIYTLAVGLGLTEDCHDPSRYW
jgi:hypothetical protein